MIYAMTDVGKKRALNEDCFYFEEAEKGYVIMVSDGMGGHNAGEVASRMAVEAIREFMKEHDIFEDPEVALRQAVTYANRMIYQTACQQTACQGMGATLVLAVGVENRIYIANLGDSRAYLISEQNITQVTKDHSYVYELVKNGMITPEEAKVHPRRNEILKALGIGPEVYPDVFMVEAEAGEKLLLCTDGLTGMVSDEEIFRTVNRLEPQSACEELVRLANAYGGSDNITVAIQ